MTLKFPIFLWILIPLIFWYISLLKEKTIDKKVSIVPLSHILIIILIVFALLRPVIKEDVKQSPIMANNIVIAIDVSYSMMATDLTPNRYKFGCDTIEELLKYRVSDNITLLAFTTNPLLLSPPTTDHQLIVTAMKSLNIEHILTKGTSIKNLFKKIDGMGMKKTDLLLITDGGEESNLATLTASMSSHIDLHILALGSQTGTTILSKDGHVIKDKDGNLVVSRINPMLKTLAQQTHGNYMEAKSTPTITANMLNDIFVSKTNRDIVYKKEHKFTELFWIPLLLATFIFLLLHTTGVKYLLILFLMFGVNVQASFWDKYHLIAAHKAYDKKDYNSSKEYLNQIDMPSLESQLAMGNTLYKNGKFEESIAIYNSILSKSINIKQHIYYNIANAYVHLGRYSKAKIYYIKTLQLKDDSDAKQNLKLIYFREDLNQEMLGISNPKSSSNQAAKSDSKDDKNKKDSDDISGASGAGSSGNKNTKESKINHISNKKENKTHPVSSKTYELINKGYIYEDRPW